jgi:molecular chaperone GrpE
MVKKVKMGTSGMNEDLQDATKKADSTMEDKTKASEEDLIVKLQEMEKKAAENYDKYVRAAAELDNYKKRAVREKAEAIKYGNENLLRDILPLVDNMDRAMEHACDSDDFNAFREGLKMLQQQLLSCLQKHGVEQIEAVGKDFDPHVHEAMLQVESKEHEESKVVGEFERGYLLNGRLLRPSKVSVCRRLNKEDRKYCEEAVEEAKNN